jgi:hypothetical protein
MRIASPSKLRRRPRVRSTLGARAVWPILLVLGCFFELEPLAELPGVGGVGGAAGSFSGAAGDGGLGGGGKAGAGGTSGGPECGPDQKLCQGGELAGQCRSNTAVEFGCGDSLCRPCNVPANTIVGCNVDSRSCEVQRCAPGFADCDGDVINDVGEIAGNGCEYSFGTIQVAATTIDVPFASITLEDGGERGDWGAIPAYALKAPCQDCLDSSLPEATAPNSIPVPRDLDAYFRVAWDRDFFYVLGEAFDNSLFENGQSVQDGRCQTGAPCEDGFTVFLDGRNDRQTQPSFRSDDIRVFLAASGKTFRPEQAPLGTGEVTSLGVPIGGAELCYRVEAKFDWQFIAATQGAQPVDAIFPPENGQQYGFDFSVNDWDPVVSSPDVFERQSQLFWLSPGTNYNHNTSGFGAMKLVGAP